MSAPITTPTIYEEVRFTSDTSAFRKAYMTSFGPAYASDGMINLFVFTDPSDDVTPNCCNIPYSSTVTTANTWHYITDEG